MHLTWEINDSSLAKWRNFVEININNDFVKDREMRNITRDKVDLSKKKIWQVLVGCLVTTQQRSGPDSKVSKFLDSNSPVLNYKHCLAQNNIDSFIEAELSRSGLRRSKDIGKYLAKTLVQLEEVGWENLISELKSIREDTNKNKEAMVANYLADNFLGLGPKQSRNFIQWIGLSKYEIPIDSRVTKTMKELGCSFVPTGTALSDLIVYNIIQDGLQEIARRLDIYPCILDACIFSSFDI